MARRRAKSRTASGSLAQMTAMAFTAPFIMSTRLTGMWLNALAPTAKGDRENRTMVVEKMAAGAESVVAANTEIARQAITAGTKMMTGSTRQPRLDVDAVVNASLKPHSKRVKANAKRLSRKT